MVSAAEKTNLISSEENRAPQSLVLNFYQANDKWHVSVNLIIKSWYVATRPPLVLGNQK
jgi:hypothetical protein